jgi:hypothetical protein
MLNLSLCAATRVLCHVAAVCTVCVRSNVMSLILVSLEVAGGEILSQYQNNKMSNLLTLADNFEFSNEIILHIIIILSFKL